MTVLVHNYEGLANLADLTTANQGGATSGFAWTLVNATGAATGKISTTKKLNGSKSLRVVCGDTDTFVQQKTLSAGVRKLALTLHVSPDQVPASGSAQLGTIRTASGNACIVVVTSAGKISVQDRSGTSKKLFATDIRTLSTTFARVEIRAELSDSAVAAPSATNGILEAGLYDGNSATPVETPFSSSAVDLRTDTVFGFIQVGKLNSLTGSAISFYEDTVGYEEGATARTGPLVEALANQVPTCTLAANRTDSVEPGETVAFSLTDFDPDGTIVNRIFRQIAGPTVAIGGTSQAPTIVAPWTLNGTILTFGYQVVDNAAASSVEATVDIQVMFASLRMKTANGFVPIQENYKFS